MPPVSERALLARPPLRILRARQDGQLVKRTYTDDEIAQARALLRANGNNAKKTALQLGVPRTTLRQWAGLSPIKGKQVSETAVDAKGEKLANQFEEITDKLNRRVLDAIDKVKVESAADVRNMLVGSGITTEKGSFARGGPTSRTESLRVSLVDPSSLRSGELTVIEGGKKVA
jgi:transposase-like protein